LEEEEEKLGGGGRFPFKLRWGRCTRFRDEGSSVIFRSGLIIVGMPCGRLDDKGGRRRGEAAGGRGGGHGFGRVGLTVRLIGAPRAYIQYSLGAPARLIVVCGTLLSLFSPLGRCSHISRNRGRQDPGSLEAFLPLVSSKDGKRKEGGRGCEAARRLRTSLC
jgi:hypothetical protein